MAPKTDPTPTSVTLVAALQDGPTYRHLGPRIPNEVIARMHYIAEFEGIARTIGDIVGLLPPDKYDLPPIDNPMSTDNQRLVNAVTKASQEARFK